MLFYSCGINKNIEHCQNIQDTISQQLVDANYNYEEDTTWNSCIYLRDFRAKKAPVKFKVNLNFGTTYRLSITETRSAAGFLDPPYPPSENYDVFLVNDDFNIHLKNNDITGYIDFTCEYAGIYNVIILEKQNRTKPFNGTPVAILYFKGK